jgi:hypothetical protein
MLQNVTYAQNEVVSLRLIDGTEIICRFITKSATHYVLRSPVKITIDEEENVKASAFMAGLTNSAFECLIDHVTVMGKTQDTLKESYVSLLGEQQ